MDARVDVHLEDTMLRSFLMLPAALLLACATPETPEATDTDVAVASQTLDLPGDATFPEGILEDGTGTLWITGFGDGSLHRILPDDTVETFKTPGEDGLRSAVGLVADAERGRLWVANFDFETFSSNFKVFDLDDGELLATVAAPADLGPHFFNEVALADDGSVYVSDTLQPRIWTAGPALDVVPSVLAEDPLLANPAEDRPFGLNGLALSPDGDHLVASVMDRLTQGGGRLVRIDRDSGAVADIALSGDLDVFGGSDGMFFEPDGRLVMVNVTPPAGLVTAELSADLSSATLTARSFADPVLDRPTSSALRDGTLWVVNSQLDHIIDDANGALDTPPQLPFQVVGVDFATLVGE